MGFQVVEELLLRMFVGLGSASSVVSPKTILMRSSRSSLKAGG